MRKRFALIIEDDDDAAIIFSEALQAANYETEIIRDGQIAREKLGFLIPDVVILDLHLPNVSGEDLLDQIRADERLAKTRVIVATADPQTAAMLHDKADLALVKPISFSQLRDMAARFAPHSIPR